MKSAQISTHVKRGWRISETDWNFLVWSLNVKLCYKFVTSEEHEQIISFPRRFKSLFLFCREFVEKFDPYIKFIIFFIQASVKMWNIPFWRTSLKIYRLSWRIYTYAARLCPKCNEQIISFPRRFKSLFLFCREFVEKFDPYIKFIIFFIQASVKMWNIPFWRTSLKIYRLSWRIYTYAARLCPKCKLKKKKDSFKPLW